MTPFPLLPPTGRLWCFGCSFTAYIWPTWADILAREWGQDRVFNCGRMGAGNTYIAQEVARHITPEVWRPGDQIMIMWSTTYREDRFVGGQWHTPGNLATQRGPRQYPREWMRDWADPQGLMIRDLAQIYLTHRAVPEARMSSIAPLDQTSQYHGHRGRVPTAYEDLWDQVRRAVPHDFYSEIWPQGIEEITRARRDSHPRPLEHLAWLERAYNYEPSDRVRQWVREQDLLIED